MEIQILQPADINELNELIKVFGNVFEMDNFRCPGHIHLKKLLNNENFFAVTAKAGNRVIAGLTVYILDQYYSEKPLAYLYDLGVLPEYQRMGVGGQLIAFTKKHCTDKGLEAVFVQAEEADGYAIDFYRSTKPTDEKQVIQFEYNLERQAAGNGKSGNK